MAILSENQKLLYEIARDPAKANNFFINLGVERYITRGWIIASAVCGFVAGMLVGRTM